MNNVWTLQANYVPTQIGLWNLPNATTPLIVSQPGNYIYTLSNECYSVSDTATIGFKPCDSLHRMSFHFPLRLVTKYFTFNTQD